MSGIDIFAWIVLITIVVTVVVIFVFLGMWPGKVARQRNHPQADAINVGSWVGLIAGGVLWPLVLIWSYSKPALAQQQRGDLERRVEALEQRLAEKEAEA